MKITIRRALLQLLFTVTALSLSHQAMATVVSWQTMLRWISSAGARNLYLVATIPPQGGGVNQITHLAATNLNPAPVPTLPQNLQFHFYSLHNGAVNTPLTGSQLSGLHQPDTSATINTQSCQTTIHSEHDDSSPLNPSLHVNQDILDVSGTPSLVLANYLFPGCMLQTLLAGNLPPVHNTLSAFHNLLSHYNQPSVPPLSKRSLDISPEQMVYTGPVVPRESRRGLLGSETPESFVIHPFIPRGIESPVTAYTPGIQILRNRYGIGRIYSTNAMFATRGTVIITVNHQQIMVASNGEGGLIALIPLIVAASWQWIPEALMEQYKHFKDRQDKDPFDRSGGGSSSGTIVR